MNEILESAGTYHMDRNAFIFGGEPLIFHCNHYNVFLQMSIEETKEYIDVYPILIDSAHEVAYTNFKNLFLSSDLNTIERKELVELHFKTAGFGLIDLSEISEDGGTAPSPSEHYSYGWKAKWGQRKKDEPGVSFFTRGFLAGATEAIYDLPLGTLETDQTKCLTKGDDTCEFHIGKISKQASLTETVMEGDFQTFDYYPKPVNSDVDYAGIREALTGLPIKGSDEDGLIDAFGVLLTRHYANYYNLISMRTMAAMEKVFGEAGVSIVKDLLVEAGHVCAFNTFGGIMLSAEWNALIKPMLKSKDDWAHGVTACINALGWGLWEISDLDADGVTSFKITSSYESNSFTKLYDKSPNYFVCCFLEGGLAGVLNLIYHGDISEEPTLDEAYYNRIFKTPGRFKCTPIKSRTKGADFDEFIVVRIQ